MPRRAVADEFNGWRIALAVVVLFAVVGWTLRQAAVFNAVWEFLSESA